LIPLVVALSVPIWNPEISQPDACTSTTAPGLAAVVWTLKFNPGPLTRKSFLVITIRSSNSVTPDVSFAIK